MKAEQLDFFIPWAQLKCKIHATDFNRNILEETKLKKKT